MVRRHQSHMINGDHAKVAQNCSTATHLRVVSKWSSFFLQYLSEHQMCACTRPRTNVLHAMYFTRVVSYHATDLSLQHLSEQERH